jgi:uncharacterized protein YcbX
MRVLELWRYPVKSLRGEQLTSAPVEPVGIAGDRRWALFDAATGLGLTARRAPQLLFAAARGRPDGGVDVVLPDGTVTDDDAVLSDWLGRPVTLRSAAAVAGAPTYESPDDDEDEAAGAWHPWRGAAGAFHDVADARLSLVSTETIEGWDRRRFRANVLLSGGGEDALIGRRIRLGSVVLEVGGGIPRCVMVTRPQPDGIDRDVSVLRTIHRERAGLLAVWARVVGTGTVAVGDELAGDAG